MICYYHGSDLDGHCAGAIVKRWYPQCKMVPVNYGDNVPHVEGRGVFVVDFSWPIEQMQRLHEQNRLRWIDHHKTAIEAERLFISKNVHYRPIPGIREIGKAGCELTCQYLYPDEPMPLAVHLLGRYDVWDHSDERVLPFQFGMRIQDKTNPDSDIWHELLKTSHMTTEYVESIINAGKHIIKYRESQNAKYAKSCAFDTEIAGYRTIACNIGLSNSQIFDSVFDPSKHDIMCTFVYRKGKWNCTLYSKDNGPDVGEIARQFGGGGHENAAGFSLETLETLPSFLA